MCAFKYKYIYTEYMSIPEVILPFLRPRSPETSLFREIMESIEELSRENSPVFSSLDGEVLLKSGGSFSSYLPSTQPTTTAGSARDKGGGGHTRTLSGALSDSEKRTDGRVPGGEGSGGLAFDDEMDAFGDAAKNLQGLGGSYGYSESGIFSGGGFTIAPSGIAQVKNFWTNSSSC